MTIEPKAMLDVSFRHADFEEPVTFRVFFQQLLLALIRKEEAFSGKRPFGNSGWTYQFYKALGKNGVPEGDRAKFVQDMIEAL